MEDTQKNYKIIEVIYVIIMYICVFQNFLKKHITILNYFDEFLAIVGLLFGFFIFFKKKLKVKKYNLIMAISLILITVIGFYSVFKFKFQTVNYAVVDWLLVMKFFFVYCLGQIAFKKLNNNSDFKIIRTNIKIITIFLFIFTISNYAFNIYGGGIRFGIKANKLFYTHQTYLAAACIVLIANNIRFDKKISNIYVYMLLIILMSTLRLKAIGAVFANLIVILYVSKSNKKISFSKLGIIGLICVVIAYNQIMFYFVKLDGAARKVLTTTSFEIANDYMPIGVGFGTFGSYVSGVNYSKVYSLYNIDNVYGLQEDRAGFITDTFWAMIVGQFGYLGTICYILNIILIFKKIQNEFSAENKKIYISKIICLIYLLISSTSETAFVNPIAIPLGLIIGI